MKKIATLVAALAIIPAFAAVSSDAEACGMSVRLEPVKAKPSPVTGDRPGGEVARVEPEHGGREDGARELLEHS